MSASIIAQTSAKEEEQKTLTTKYRHNIECFQGYSEDIQKGSEK